MSDYTDELARQGIACGMIYGFVFEPPHGPPHRCPWCQPCPDEPTKAAYWQRWHDIETRLMAKGDTSACPVRRGETVPNSYTNEERAALGIKRASMPSIEEASRVIVPELKPFVVRRPIADELPSDDEFEMFGVPKKSTKSRRKKSPD